MEENKKALENMVKTYCLNSRDNTHQYSLTEFPNEQLLQLSTNRSHRVRMVSFEVEEIFNETDDLDLAHEHYFKVPPRSLIPPSSDVPNGGLLQWQVNLSANDTIRQEQLPSVGTIRATIHHKIYNGSFSAEDARETDEGTIIPVSIAEETSGLPHEVFSHVKMLVDKDTNKLTKMFMVQDWGNEEEGLNKRNHAEIDSASEQLVRTRISSPKRVKSFDDLDSMDPT